MNTFFSRIFNHLKKKRQHFETLLPLPEYSFQTTCKGDVNKLSFNKANVQTEK